MTREQIYIDGVLMEQAGDKAASLVFSSPFFTEIDNITANRSNSVDFPATPANLRALGLSHLDRSGSKYAGQKHAVQYYLDGVQIFSGTAVLQGITPTALKFSFTWGNTDAFKALLDIRLRDLQTNDAGDYVTYTQGGMQTAGRSLDNIDTGRAAMPLPFMTAVEILTRLGTQAGVTIDTTPFAGLALPLQTRTANAEAIAAQGYILRRGQTYRAITTNSIQQTLRLYGIKYNSLTYDSDLQGIADGELLDIDGIDKLRITVDKGTEYVMRMSLSDYNNSVIRSLSGVSLWACDEDGESCKRIAFLTGCTVTSYTGGGDYFQRVTYERKVKVDVDVSQYSYLRIGVGQAGTLGDYAQGYYLNAGRIAIATNPDTDTEVVVGGKLPLWLNLPDWTGGQLLKNLMKMQGLFPVCPNGAAIDFISVAELYTNRPDALDWTARLDWEGGQPDERTSALQGYAQHNHFRYTPDESVAGDYDGVLEIYDSTLESDGDLVTLDFAATDGGDRPRIPAWELDDSSQWQFIGGNYGQRILRLNDGAYTFKGLSWPELLNAYYRDYAVIVAQPRVVKARVVVDAAELATLDLTRPVYSYGAGRYFALTKLTTNGDGTATADLLRLSALNESQSNIGFPTAAEPSEALAVMLDDGGDWVTVLTDLTDAQNAVIAADGAYRIVLERWGFARRGEYYKYINKYGQEQTTHSCRRGYGLHQTPDTFDCYDADGNSLGHNIASVPDGGWVWTHYPRRKYVYNADGGYWTEQGEGHIYNDSLVKGDSLKDYGQQPPSFRYNAFENTRDLNTKNPKRWRAIGWDILLHGSEPADSQTFNSGRYAGATLVCSLGDALVLPSVKAGGVKHYNHAKGSSGRVHNRSKNGLTELAVSLWHWESGSGWVRVSNRVRVRSRSKDCSQMWEFTEGNVIDVYNL